MKKVLVALVAFAVLSVGMAHSFTVGAAYDSGLSVVAEYGLPVERVGELLVGVSVVPLSWDTEVSLGARAFLGTVDTADFGLVLRTHLPVREGDFWVLGQVRGSVGFDAIIRQDQNNFSLVPSVGVSAPLNAAGFSSLPDLTFGIALRWDTEPVPQFSLFDR